MTTKQAAAVLAVEFQTNRRPLAVLFATLGAACLLSAGAIYRAERNDAAPMYGRIAQLSAQDRICARQAGDAANTCRADQREAWEEFGEAQGDGSLEGGN